MNAQTTARPDYQAITWRQQAVWSAGDFAQVASRNLLAAELLCESLDVRPGERVLDVAGGTGNAALARRPALGRGDGYRLC